MRHPGLALSVTATIVVVADQLSKAIVRMELAELGSVAVWPGVFYITHQRNMGAAFGLMQGGRILFIAVAIGALGACAWYWNKWRPTAWPLVIALGLVVGGAIGNLIDRILVGSVTDFLDFALVRFPVFNIADMALVTGTALLVLLMLLAPEESQSERESDSSEPAPGP